MSCRWVGPVTSRRRGRDAGQRSAAQPAVRPNLQRRRPAERVHRPRHRDDPVHRAGHGDGHARHAHGRRDRPEEIIPAAPTPRRARLQRHRPRRLRRLRHSTTSVATRRAGHAETLCAWNAEPRSGRSRPGAGRGRPYPTPSACPASVAAPRRGSGGATDEYFVIEGGGKVAGLAETEKFHVDLL